jgi:23S rRNA (uracil1939-C5)-methyltransferase
MAKRKGHLDVLFMDPPRKGSTPKFLSAALALEPKKIVYVSCNPLTLARDLKVLKSKYKVEKVQPVDEFGRNYHVETVVLLTKF